ncbi:HNH endonuclease [Streptomyces griseoflavus]|uniref:HNH endonuclease n=1 Tax=Streptomyces griseoflavus TaxID=35619 RepID=UPI003D73E8CF
MSDAGHLPGPLGNIARQVHARRGVDAQDAFAAAVCWWSAAIAPAARSIDWPVLVWGVFLSDVNQYTPSLSRELRQAGFEEETVGPPHLHSQPGEREVYGAVDALLGTAEAGHERSLLLTGDPLYRPPTGRRVSLHNYVFLRLAWDGKEYRPDKWQQSAPVTPPPVGVLWETSRHAWEQATRSLDAATTSRLMLFRRRSVVPAPGSVDLDGAALTELAQARAWALSQRPRVFLDATAAEMLDTIHRYEKAFAGAGPDAMLVRTHAHTHRIASVLAVADRSSLIRPQHLQAAWNLARRSCLDVQSLLGPRGTNIGAVVEDVDAQLRTIIHSHSKEISSPPSGHNSASALAGIEDDTAEQPTAASTAEVVPVRRRSTVVDSQVRDTGIVKTVKQWYGNRCQMCETVLRVPGQAGAYSEGAHIQAVGHPHNGPDRIENLLCLCPNCHIQFDNGALYLTDDLYIIDAFTHHARRQLTVDPRHDINAAHIRHHREYWTTGSLPGVVRQPNPGMVQPGPNLAVAHVMWDKNAPSPRERR